MYDDIITVFNFHEKTGTWRTTVFEGVNLYETNAGTATRDSGKTNGDTVELIIPTQADKSANTLIYRPYLILTNDGDYLVDRLGVRLSSQKPDTDEIRWYTGPKAYAKLDNPQEFFTFKAETDFFVVGNHFSLEPISDDDYDEGLYHEMNNAQDGVYMINSAAFFSLLPHFEIGGR